VSIVARKKFVTFAPAHWDHWIADAAHRDAVVLAIKTYAQFKILTLDRSKQGKEKTMFKIKWRNRNKVLLVVEGLSRYASRDLAEKQVAIWEQVFPFVTYYIVSA
jgi:hypothetical protein